MDAQVCGMSFEEYQALDAVNWSTLKECRKSPLHYKHALSTPRQDRTSFKVGRAAHTALLEPHLFESAYAFWDGDRRGNAFKAFEAEAIDAGRTVLKVEERDRCLAMAKAIREHPIAGPFFAAGEAEQVLVWTDPDTGLRCKGRVDWLSANALVDVKSAADIGIHRFGANAARMGYHCQLAFYRRGLRALERYVPQTWIVAVEAEAPHDVAPLTVSEDDLFVGDEEVGELLTKVAECRDSGIWPGQYAGAAPLLLPSWVFEASDGDNELEGLGLVIDGEAA